MLPSTRPLMSCCRKMSMVSGGRMQKRHRKVPWVPFLLGGCRATLSRPLCHFFAPGAGATALAPGPEAAAAPPPEDVAEAPVGDAVAVPPPEAAAAAVVAAGVTVSSGSHLPPLTT